MCTYIIPTLDNILLLLVDSFNLRIIFDVKVHNSRPHVCQDKTLTVGVKSDFECVIVNS